ncbi:MAG: retropepsin-like aspartic protease [Syntrophales bacterium]|nr:retropepsin-like aspartic protease [Syntrophales bacterium]
MNKEYVIPFRKAYGGILVDVIINDTIPAKMLLDTGATTVKINVSLLKKLNQYLPADLKKGKALTAAGVVDVQEVFIEKIDLGGAVKTNVQASFVSEEFDQPFYDGLLGLSFLSDFKMAIDYEKNLIRLTR